MAEAMTVICDWLYKNPPCSRVLDRVFYTDSH